MNTAPGLHSMRSARVFWLPAGALLLFVVLALPRTRQIAGQDEVVHYLALGRRLFEEGFRRPEELIAFSPHLYGFVLWAAHRLAGPGVAPARLPGVASWCLAGFVLWGWLARRPRAGGPRVAGWALAALVTMPLAVQAAAIVDIDNTILVPAVLALCLAAAQFVERPGRRAGALAALAMAAALWCRLTTPAVLVPVILVWAWFHPAGGRRAVAGLALALAAGSVLFLATWWLYCRATGVSFAGPFRYLAAAAAFCTVGQERGIRPGKIVLSVLYTLFWVGPALACLWAVLGVRRVRRFIGCRRLELADLFLAAGAAVLAGYCVVGGTIFGFPKYHCPAAPLLLLALAASSGEALNPGGRNGWLAAGGLLLGGAALQAVVVGDPLYVLRVSLREAVFRGEGPLRVLAAGLAGPMALGGAAGAAALAILCRGRVIRLEAGLLALAIGMNAGLLLLQQAGGYQTGYNYGDQGDARAVAGLLAESLPPDASAVVPGEVVHLLGRPSVTHVPNELWLDAEALRRTLGRDGMAAAAVSLLTNTMAQTRTLIEAAGAVPGYERLDVGRYAVFVRRLPAPAAPPGP